MATTALQMEKMRSVNQLIPARGPNIYPAGLSDDEKGYVRYAYPSSKHPNLILVNAITDDDGNMLLPGYYELVLSEDRTMLVLVQSGKQLATIPVFLLQEDKTQEEAQPPTNSKELRKYEKAQKKKNKKNEKLLKEGKIESLEPQIHMDATIQYDPDGYYLLKYERGRIRAWGAIK